MNFTQVAEAVRPWVPDIQPLRDCENHWLGLSLWSARYRNTCIVYALSPEELVEKVQHEKEERCLRDQ